MLTVCGFPDVVEEVDGKISWVKNEISRLSHAIDSVGSASGEWFDLVQERKVFHRGLLLLESERRDLIPRDLRVFEEKVANLRLVKRSEPRGNFVNSGVITRQNLRKILSSLSAFTGIPVEDLHGKFSSMDGDLTENVRNFWGECSLRSDKPLLSLDLEVAAPLVYNQVDMGDYSSIIEVGYVKLCPSGDVLYGGFFCGIERELELTIGTGAVDIHHITPSMVAGIKPLSLDGARREEFLGFMDGCVILAHNADYEVSQLSRSIEGFSDCVASGSIEIFDSRVVAKYLIGGLRDNTNQSFVEYAGGDYVGAHRAFDDAYMTLNALLSVKGMAGV